MQQREYSSQIRKSLNLFPTNFFKMLFLHTTDSYLLLEDLIFVFVEGTCLVLGIILNLIYKRI